METVLLGTAPFSGRYMGSKWYVGFAAGSSTNDIYEIDLAASSPKQWRIVATLSSVSLSNLGANSPSMLSGCGDLLMWVGMSYRPVLIDPETNRVVADAVSAVNTGLFPAVYDAPYGSDTFTCTMYSAGGASSSNQPLSSVYRYGGTYESDGLPGVTSIAATSIAARSVSLKVNLRFNGGLPADSVSATCIPTSSSGLDATWSNATTSINNETGTATLVATNLLPNTTYSCTANATIGGSTSSPSPAAIFTTLVPQVLEIKPVAPGSFAGRQDVAGVLFRNATGGYKLLIIGGMTQSQSAVNEVHVYDSDTDAWSTSSVTQPMNARAAACSWDEKTNGYVWCSGGFDSSTSAASASFWRFPVSLSSREDMPPMPVPLVAHCNTYFSGAYWVLANSSALLRYFVYSL
eukprot:tig00021015_g17155.t1